MSDARCQDCGAMLATHPQHHLCRMHIDGSGICTVCGMPRYERPHADLNFCRVFELPEVLPEDFCFNGGITTRFLMVDWFNPWPYLSDPNHPSCPNTWAEVETLLKQFLRAKDYIRTGKKYVVITDFGKSFMV